MNVLKNGVCGALFCLWVTLSAAGQTPPADDPWAKLSTVSPSVRVRAEMAGGARYSGMFAGVEGNRVILRLADGKPMPLDRGDLRRMSRRSRARGALYGLAIGFAAGFVTGVAGGAYIADYGNPSGLRRIQYGVGFGLFSGGVGAGIGALTGARVTIYP